MSGKNKSTGGSPVSVKSSDDVEVSAPPVAVDSHVEEAPVAPVTPPAKKKRVELVASVKAQARKITVGVYIELDDVPLLSVVRAKAAQGEAKAKSVMLKISKVVGSDAQISLSPAKLDLVGKQIVVELRMEPELSEERLEAVRKAVS